MGRRWGGGCGGGKVKEEGGVREEGRVDPP